MIPFLRGAVLVLVAAGLGHPAAGQQPSDPPAGEWDAMRVQMSRASLEDLLNRLDASQQSTAYSGAIRGHAAREAAAVRARLVEGDFQVGDRVVLKVEAEPELTDTFTVGSDRTLTLPIVGAVPLTGVLHSELQDHLRASIGRYVRDPVVHARSLIRIAVLGEVERPGYYVLPTQTVVTDAVMAAGGPTRDAKLKDVRIVRGDERVWDGSALQQAMSAGETFDQLSLVAGDRIEVPKEGQSLLSFNTVTALSFLVGLPATLYGLTKLF